MSNRKRQEQHMFITVFVAIAAIVSTFIVMASSTNISISYAQMMNQMDQTRNQMQSQNPLMHLNATATAPTSSSSAIQLSQNPIQEERIKTTSQTPINQTHLFITYSGNGTVTPPNTTTTAKTINITANGSAIVSIVPPLSLYGKETIRTEDGQIATTIFYEIVQVNPVTREGKGITMAVIRTDSTGTLAPLNGTIGVGIDNIQSNGDETFTIWKWESGISIKNNINSTGIAGSTASALTQGQP